MEEENYSKREQDQFMEQIHQTLGRIEAQTTKTNGRVTKVERWMYMVVGAVSIMGFLIGAKLLTFIK